MISATLTKLIPMQRPISPPVLDGLWSTLTFVYNFNFSLYLPVLESQVIQDIATSRLYLVTYGSLRH